MLISRRGFIAVSTATTLAEMVRNRDSNLYAESYALNDDLTLTRAGNQQQGYGVTIQFRGEPIARHNGGGEFSAVFQNEDRSLKDTVANWRAASCTGSADHMLLEGECKLPNLNASIFAQVEYQVVAPHVLQKQIRFHQVAWTRCFISWVIVLSQLTRRHPSGASTRPIARAAHCANTFPLPDSAPRLESRWACSPIPATAINGAV